MRFFVLLLSGFLFLSSCKKSDSVAPYNITYKFSGNVDDSYIITCSNGVGGLQDYTVNGKKWTLNATAYQPIELKLLIRPDVAVYTKSSSAKLEITVNKNTKASQTLTLDAQHTQVGISYLLPSK